MRIDQQNNTHVSFVLVFRLSVVMTIINTSASGIVMLNRLSGNFFKSSCHCYSLLMNAKCNNPIFVPLFLAFKTNGVDKIVQQK